MKEIVVTIKKDATLVIEPTKGFSGGTCLAETKSLEEALGKVEKRTPKPEMYAPDVGDRTTVGSG
jgi:bifunctional N-acetylglucosamine-1-phosphate-uridyltransferase/glucosamine-1-phosphate-acetyltransferase GlmU-like protein